MMEVLEKGIGKEQAGFRPDFPCMDKINTLRMINEQSAEITARHSFLLISKSLFTLKEESLNIWRFLGTVAYQGKS